MAFLDEILEKEFPVLDHGFVRVIDYMGDDSAIVQAARVSYGEGTKSLRDDIGLINYLMQHRHTTPFEMCEIKFHIKLPIFVARQWIRHRTANINEYSARYSIVKDEFYVPYTICKQSENNKQGSGEELSSDVNKQFRESFINCSQEAYKQYKQMLDSGVARETARMILPVNFYTEWYWKIDLHNLLHFLHLRLKENAQFEIRAYAEAIAKIVSWWTPLTFNAFEKYRLNSTIFSSTQIEILRRIMKGEKVSVDDSGLSQREFSQLRIIFETLDN